MNNLEILAQFGKGKTSLHQRKSTNSAVIYTRVSSKEQADTNQSLEIQKRYCLEYALKHGLNILGFFGGTYESAKTDERNEFNQMISFVKNQKEGVSIILVYSLDRFSRTGDNAIFISSELKKRGISIISVTQPIDVSTHAGVLQQNIQFIFSKYDNDLRREKCIAGMKEKLMKGDWTGGAPLGYEYDRTGKQQRIVINQKGTLLRKGFELKSQGMSNTDVAYKLKCAGLVVDKKRLSEIFRNPFYCGYISHTLLEGHIVKGNHEALVSERLFLQVNNALKKNAYGYKQREQNKNVPLKNYVRCAECGTPFTAYIVKSKGLYYYKCNRIGCKCNRRAGLLHELYVKLLGLYQIDKNCMGLLSEQLLLTYQHLTQSGEELRSISTKNLSELNKKLEKMEERFAMGEIDRDIFEKIGGKVKEEIRLITRQSDGSKKKLSNPEKFISHALEICSNLSELWVSAQYEQKIQFQELLFPGGILFDRKIENYRTIEVNPILELTHCFIRRFEENKSGHSRNLSQMPALVVSPRIELGSKV